MWFQQDGATSHTANVTINLLVTKFAEGVISRNGPVDWPPRSCDLTPLDYFLWGYVKSMVYGNKPVTVYELRTNIEHEIAVSADLCLKIVKYWVQRLQACPWWSCRRNRVSFIMTSKVLLQESRIYLIFKLVFVLFKKTFVALLLKNPLVWKLKFLALRDFWRLNVPT